MRKIYLDTNVIIDIQNSRNEILCRKIKLLDKTKNQILFSPAHIEEIAATLMHYGQGIDRVDEKINFLASLTESTAILPYHMEHLQLLSNEGIFIYKENPKYTYERVVNNYSVNKQAETIQKERLSSGVDLEKSSGITSKEINNTDIASELNQFKPALHAAVIMQYIKLMQEGILKEYLPKKIPGRDNLNFSYARKFFPIHEFMVEKIFTYLELRRFYPDNPTKSISSLHDTTHAIYAAYCDIFVTNDNKLRNKTNAAYKWLKINTLILNPTEFVERIL